MAKLFLFRLSSLLLLVFAIAVILGVYSARRRHAMSSWAETTGLWKLTSIVFEDNFTDQDVPDWYLHIDGLSLEHIDVGLTTTGKVIPRVHGIDMEGPDDTLVHALYECSGGRLTICHSQPGEKRPNAIPSDKSSVDKNALYEYERVAPENLDQVMAKIEARRRFAAESPNNK